MAELTRLLCQAGPFVPPLGWHLDKGAYTSRVRISFHKAELAQT
jgi:hypothetical protein